MVLWRKITFLLMMFLLIGNDSYAGPWTCKKGETGIALTHTNYKSDRSYNRKMKSVPSDLFKKNESELFVEHGVTDDVTLGGVLRYDWLKVYRDSGIRKNVAVGDVDFFGRYRLWQNNYHVFSLQGLVKLPGTFEEKDPIIGYRQNDCEARFLYGFSHYDAYIPWFFAIEGGHRWRFNGPADEVRLDATLGFKFTKSLMLIFQSFNTIGSRNAKDDKFTSSGTLSFSDYDCYKTRTSIYWSVKDNTQIFIGYEREILGRNTIRGHAIVGGLNIHIQ